MPLSANAAYEKLNYVKDQWPFGWTLSKTLIDKDIFDLRYHEEIEIKYILSGSLSINFGTNVIRAEAGDIVVVNSCEYHANQLEAGEEATYHMLYVDLSRFLNNNLLAHYFAPYKSGNLRFQNLIRGDQALQQHADQLFSSLTENENYLMSCGLFLAFLSRLMAHVDSEKTFEPHSKRLSQQKKIVNHAISYIHTHYHEEIRLADIARECIVSESHFCRIFKEFTGDTPTFYINRLRINKAISLLSNTSHSISEIAAMVGFDDNAYFCRIFKKYVGFSPSTYLKQQIAESSASSQN